MTIIRFFSDPHLGRDLKANTVPASRELLREQLYLHALQAASLPHPAGAEVAATVCAGDLFDTDTNPEHILLQGYAVANKCSLVLGGNHDVVNIQGRESTLSALAQLTYDERFILPPGPGRSAYETHSVGTPGPDGVRLFMVPHHATQQDFDDTLERIYGEVFLEGQTEPVPGRRLLVLHCNYHLTMEAGENDINLTDAKARKMLKLFDYLVMGHDHRPRVECDGRVVILGNTHPTCFSDQGKKLVWFYDSETNRWTTEVNCPEASWTVPAGELIDMHREGRLGEMDGAEWLDVFGTLPPEEAVDLAKAVRATWKAQPGLYAIRASRVQFAAEGLDSSAPVEATQKTLLELVEEDLAKAPELLELFREAREAE